MSRQQKSAIDPVLLTSLGIGLVTVAVVLLAFQPQGNSAGAATSSFGQIILAFITGLTTGGLSCLAVQGGLLASSLAHQIEQDYLEHSAQPKKRGKKDQIQPRHPSTAVPILLFLASKLAAYTLLGALLGWLGSYSHSAPQLVPCS
jgi:hypothetical protein